MSAVRGYVLWRLKDGVTLKKEDLTYFSPGGYAFTHRSGMVVGFDFEESSSNFKGEEGIIETTHREIDNEIITSSLEEIGASELVQEEYDINFFREGVIDLDISCNEMHVCIDVKVNGEIQEDYDETTLMEPVYMDVYDPYNPEDCVTLYNKLSEEEYNKYIGGIDMDIDHCEEKDLVRDVYNDFNRLRSVGDLLQEIAPDCLSYKIIEFNGRTITYDGRTGNYETYYAPLKEEKECILNKIQEFEMGIDFWKDRLKAIEEERTGEPVLGFFEEIEEYLKVKTKK